MFLSSALHRPRTPSLRGLALASIYLIKTASPITLAVFVSGKVGKYAGGNPVCDRPTPDWQKGISSFLKKLPEKENSGEKTDADADDVECVTMEAVGARCVLKDVLVCMLI